MLKLAIVKEHGPCAVRRGSSLPETDESDNREGHAVLPGEPAARRGNFKFATLRENDPSSPFHAGYVMCWVSVHVKGRCDAGDGAAPIEA